MPAARRIIPTDDRERWADLRARAAEADARARGRGIGPRVPVLDAIAWLSGFPQVGDTMMGLVDRARAERYSWREIALAEGDTDDRPGEGRAQARQAGRKRRAKQRGK